MDNQSKPKPKMNMLDYIMENINNYYAAAVQAIMRSLLPEKFKALRHSITEEDVQGIHRRRACDTAKPTFVMPHNVFEVLYHGRELSGNGPCVGRRLTKKGKYEWLSYQDVIDRATNFGAGLMMLGGKSDGEYLIGIFAKTCAEWTIAEFGCFAYGMATAPLYDSLGPDTCQETVNVYDIEMMLCGGEEQVAALLSGDKFPTKLRTVIVINPLNQDALTKLENLGVKVLTMEDVEQMGAQNPRPLSLATTDTLASLIFTSGTTGPPKGAMLTHSCFMLAMKSFIQAVQAHGKLRFSTEDTCLGEFPLSHIFERVCEKLIHLHGAKVGYIWDTKSMSQDAKELRPTFFFFVPRLMNRFYDEIIADMQSSWFGRTFGQIALAAKYRLMRAGVFSHETIWDRILFRKYQNILGGNVRVSFIGSAASDGEVLNFCRAVFGCYIFEMYGQTECSGPITCTSYGDCTTGHVGIPFPDAEVKLVDVPEMGYFAKDNAGEICSRSPFIMRGYYKMPEKTAETVDSDGWLHTGDIGMWTEDGKLKIFDRKKHIFKLSQGEYLAPERLEGIFSRSSYIINIFIDGDSKYPYPVALVYPNYEALGVLPSQITFDGKETSHEKYIREKIMEDLIRIGKESAVKSYEIPKRFAILKEPFSVENNCLTPLQKTKREVVRALHRDCLRDLYESH